MGINTLASRLDAVAAPVPKPQVRLPNNAHCPVFAPFSETRRWRTNRAAPLGARARLSSVPRAMREGIDLERVARRFRRLSRRNDAIRTGTRAQCARDPPRGFPPDPHLPTKRVCLSVRSVRAKMKAFCTSRLTEDVAERSPTLSRTRHERNASASPACAFSCPRANVAAPAASASRSTTRRSTAWTTTTTWRRRVVESFLRRERNKRKRWRP